jgi:hypothetical protein
MLITKLGEARNGRKILFEIKLIIVWEAKRGNDATSFPLNPRCPLTADGGRWWCRELQVPGAPREPSHVGAEDADARVCVPQAGAGAVDGCVGSSALLPTFRKPISHATAPSNPMFTPLFTLPRFFRVYNFICFCELFAHPFFSIVTDTSFNLFTHLLSFIHYNFNCDPSSPSAFINQYNTN